MADNSFSNFTVFRLSGTPSFGEIIKNFRDFRELAAPVVTAQNAQLTLYTIPSYSDKGLTLLPVFTDPGLIKPPFFSRPPLAFLQTLFSAPAAGSFAFNPPHGPAPVPAAEVRLDKRQISLIIGFLQTAAHGSAGAESEDALKNEIFSGSIHRAHYAASALITADPSRPCALYAEILIDLGLLQEAYDYVKTFQTPEFFYSRALILRQNGDTAKARQWLDKIQAGTPHEDKKRLESAWLLLEEGKTDEALNAFRTLSENSSEKTAALFGAGSALIKKAAAERSPACINEGLSVLSEALKSPSSLTSKILFNMGNLYFRAGNFAEAEACYRKAEGLRPMVQSKANLGLALIKTGKLREAAALINDIALTDLNAAGRLVTELPRESAAELLNASRQHREEFTARQPDPTGAPAAVSLEAAAPRTVARAISPEPAPQKRTEPGAHGLQMESLMETMSAAPAPTEAETRKDDFMGRAFKLASSLEDEFNKKIFFNADSLTEVEKKLRMTFMKSGQNSQKAIETVKDCSAFLCFLMQERYKGRLIKMPDFDHWGWPMVFETPKYLMTYPIQRAWKMLWQENVPEPGWLTKYLQYIEEELTGGTPDKPQGPAGVQGKVPSHPERLIDVQTEHKRIMLLVSTLEETSDIELSRSGIAKLEAALIDKFKPDTPPNSDGWKLLRCYGHILAEILIKDFKAVWYNAQGNDGLWSMQLPWKTFIFPIGKVYKAASNRESLANYYDMLLAEKLRNAGGPGL